MSALQYWTMGVIDSQKYQPGMESDQALVVVPLPVGVQQVRIVGSVIASGYRSTDTHREDAAEIELSAKLGGTRVLRPW